ncbi:MAG: SDR family oxidoreductase [Oscillospiraceae bacterium]
MKALVTGASSGIGRDIAIYLGNLGYDLVLVARGEEKLLEIKKLVKTNVRTIPMDLSDINSCYKLFEITKDDGIDVLINNAGFGIFGEFAETSLEKELNMIDLNVKSIHVLTKLFYSLMREKKSGYILNVSSSAGLMAGGPLMAAYYASKSYVTSLSLGISEEIKREKSGVSISILCPGPVNTDFDKRAGVNFTMKGLQSKAVAKYAVDKMFKKKLVIIPGAMIKLGIFATRFVSRNFLLHVAYSFQKSKEIPKK